MEIKPAKLSRKETHSDEPSFSAAKRGNGSGALLGEIDAALGDPNFMTTLARGLAVIGAFTEQRRRLTIAQVSHKTGIPRAAVRRCLYTLEKLDYVGAEAHTFFLRPKVLMLGHAYLSSTPLAVSAQPVLDRVSSAVDESCSLAILDNDEIVYIARSATSRITAVAPTVGSRLPAYCTSMGRVLLSQLTEREVNAYLARVELRPLVHRTVTSPEKLRQLLLEARQAGYAVVDQELELGLRSIAVPVRQSSGTVIAAVNVSTHAARATVRQMEARFLPYLQAAASELGAQFIG